MAEVVSYVGLDEDDAVAEEQIKVTEKAVEVEGNIVADAANRLAEAEAKAAELQAKLDKQQSQMQFFSSGGNWKEMPDQTEFYLTIIKDKNSPARSKFDIVSGNAHTVHTYNLKRDEAHRVPKEVVWQIERAKVDGWYPVPNERGEKEMVHTYEPRFEYRVLPAWD